MKNTVRYIVLALLLVILAIGCEQYWRLFKHNISTNSQEQELIYLLPNQTIDQLINIIQEKATISSEQSLRFHCRLLKFSHTKAGCYAINPTEGDLAFIRRLRAGEQTPISITFNHIRTPQQLAHRLSEQLMLDSASIADRLLSDSAMAQYGLNHYTSVCMFLPDTYEIYWTISPDQLFERMYQQYKNFWNTDRLQKARQLNLTPTEVATIASIAEEETNKQFEYPIIAGLYINRLRRGMNLQACPTIKYAWQDFSLRRILNKHLTIDSPYNTYKYAGLPPGPIRLPRASTLDAVLNYTPSNYLYMCASAEFNGTHHFSSTYREHAQYARIYQKELNKRNIK